MIGLRWARRYTDIVLAHNGVGISAGRIAMLRGTLQKLVIIPPTNPTAARGNSMAKSPPEAAKEAAEPQASLPAARRVKKAPTSPSTVGKCFQTEPQKDSTPSRRSRSTSR